MSNLIHKGSGILSVEIRIHVYMLNQDFTLPLQPTSHLIWFCAKTLFHKTWNWTNYEKECVLWVEDVIWYFLTCFFFLYRTLSSSEHVQRGTPFNLPLPWLWSCCSSCDGHFQACCCCHWLCTAENTWSGKSLKHVKSVCKSAWFPQKLL